MRHEPGSVRVAVVTGGTRGIGRATVERLLAQGWRVYFCGRTEESAAQAERELAEGFPGAVHGRGVDVGRQEEVDAFAAWVLEREAGRVDCLVNNAGWGIFAPVDEISGEDWRGILDTNLSGAFYCTRAFAPAMKRRGGGWIFNVASLAGKNPFSGGAAYNASKFGLVGFSEASMLDLRQHGIRVAALLPGSVDTSFGRRQGRSGESWMLAPEDVARLILDFLEFPDRALPSLVEIRPSRPPAR